MNKNILLNMPLRKTGSFESLLSPDLFLKNSKVRCSRGAKDEKNKHKMGVNTYKRRRIY